MMHFIVELIEHVINKKICFYACFNYALARKAYIYAYINVFHLKFFIYPYFNKHSFYFVELFLSDSIRTSPT